MRLQPRENVKMALDAVWAHRFRSGLTILGIVIGITTVVTVASLLTGLRKGIVTFFNEFGPDNIFIARFSGDPGSNGTPKEQKRRPMRPEYAEMLERQCTSVAQTAVSLYVPPIIHGRPLIAKVPGFETDSVNVAAGSYSQLLIQPRELQAGLVFTPEEAQRGDRVAILGANLATALFPTGSAVTQAVNVDGAEYRVIGVFAPAKGAFFGENDSISNFIYRCEQPRFGIPEPDRFIITAKARPGMRDQALEELQAAMRRIRRTPAGPDDFTLSTPDQIIKRLDSLTGMIVLVSIAISALGWWWEESG